MRLTTEGLTAMAQGLARRWRLAPAERDVVSAVFHHQQSAALAALVAASIADLVSVRESVKFAAMLTELTNA